MNCRFDKKKYSLRAHLPIMRQVPCTFKGDLLSKFDLFWLSVLKVEIALHAFSSFSREMVICPPPKSEGF